MPRAKLETRESDATAVKTESSDAKQKALRALVEGERDDGTDADGVRRAVTLDGLKKEFGPAKGRKLYFAISEFLRAGADDTYTPPIQLPAKSKGRTPTGGTVDLAGDREAVEAILAEAAGDSAEASEGAEGGK